MKELDGTLLSGTVAGNRIKKFFPRSGIETSRPELEPTKEDDQQENSPSPPLLVEENDSSSSALSSLDEEEMNRDEEEDIGGEEGFREHEGTRFRSQRRQ